MAATYGTALTSGTKLIAVVGNDGGSGSVGLPTGISDGTNSMTQLAVASSGTNGHACVSLWAMDTPAGDVGATPTITASFSGSVDVSILIQEVSGLLPGNTTAMADGTAGTSSGTGGGNTTSPSYSSTAASEYLIACFSDNAFTDTVTDPGSPWTSDASNPAGGGVVHAHVVYKNSGNGAETGAVFNYSNAGADYAELLIAFKVPTAGTNASAGLAAASSAAGASSDGIRLGMTIRGS